MLSYKIIVLVSFFASSLSLGAGWSASYHACMLGDTEICTQEVRKTVDVLMSDKSVENYLDYYHSKYHNHTIIIEGEGISDLSPLSDLIELRRLVLSRNNIKCLKPLSDLKKLEWLYIDNNKISELDGIEKLNNLTWLKADYNQIENIDLIENLSAMKQLNLNYNRIKSVQSLLRLPNLISMDIKHNPINDDEYESLNNLPRLYMLDDRYL